MDEWNKVDVGFGETWDPEAEGAEKTLTGKYVELRSGVGPNDSNVYVFEKEGGSRVDVWGCTVLNGKFKTIELGTTCKLEFLGRVPNKSGSGKPYKNFEVYTKS